ncbi:MAG: PIG-L deacetylase family protein [Verrucomicrobiia bacterium]
MTSSQTAIAIGAHPDDIEFGMAGTLLKLRDAGWEIHYLNLATGNCGSANTSAAETRRIRGREARAAARMMEAKYHPPFLDDLEIFYRDSALRKLAAILRDVQPSILLTHSPQDYMEDHMITARLAVTAAFARGMPNYRTRPRRRPTEKPVTVYHAMPHGLRDGLRQKIVPGLFVDTTSVHALKRNALGCHRSQKEWLDVSQGMDSYLHSLDTMSLDVGRMSGHFQHAEGWRRHSHLGFCASHADPLREALPGDSLVNEAYEQSLG